MKSGLFYFRVSCCLWTQLTPRKPFALWEAWNKTWVVLSHECSSHWLWAAAYDSLRGSQLHSSPRHLPAIKDSGVTCMKLALVLPPASHILLLEMGPHQCICIYIFMCFQPQRDFQACCEHVMWMTFPCHFLMGTQLQQIPGNLIPEINMEELKQQYLSSTSDS